MPPHQTIPIAVLFVLTALIVLATALPLLPWPQWWIRVLEFPRLQVAVLAALVQFAWLPFWTPGSAAQTVAILMLAAALVVQVRCIVPYTPLWSVQARSAVDPASSATLRILISNVRMENREAGALRRLVETHDPDVVLALEPDAWWAAALEPLKTTHPHVVCRPQDNTYGMLLYSKLPLRDTVVRELTRPGIPSIRTDLELPDGRLVRFHGLHPPPPVIGHALDSLPRDAELVRVAREVAALDRPTIVAGDMNDVAWSRITCLFQRLSGLLDPRVGRTMCNSFHADWVLARWPLDHVFFSRAFQLVALERLGSIGSDHFPLLVAVTLAPARAGRHDPPPAAGASDRLRARATLEAAAAGDPS